VGFGIEHEKVLAVRLDLEIGVYDSKCQLFIAPSAERAAKHSPSAWIRYAYFKTSAKKKLSWTLS
jgi:hypothetical protein